MIQKICSYTVAVILCFLSLFGLKAPNCYKTAEPNNLSTYSEKQRGLVMNADYYVSTNGNDSNDGTFSSPFATIERAKTAVRNTVKDGKTQITVAVKAGEYRVNSLNFSSDEGGTDTCNVKYCAYGDGEVIINGGVTLNNKKFTKVTDKSVLDRLSKNAKQNVYCYNLKEDGITKEDYGKIYAIGSYNTAGKYTGDWTGPLYCELFVNDLRMTLARYPDSGFLKTGKVVQTGEGLESDGSLTKNDNWDNVVNPVSDIYKIDYSLAKRISSWKTLDDVWMFGFWKYDWADASSPIGDFNFKNRTISPKFVSVYGTKTDAPYYFFNVLEELDNPGEWYLDRNTGILYLYPSSDISNSVIDLSLSVNNVICGTGLKNITFEGLTVKGTRSDAVNLSGDKITVKNCLIKNVSGNAIYLSGYDNLVSECEITRTGRGGITLNGGDTETLKPGNNKADNNFIHDWSEIYQTYQPAVSLGGVGNICSHNEIYNSPHEAITYGGNNHIIEYNLIHDVCLLSDDAGAIYSGRHWDWYGNIIRYNAIYDLGSDIHSPCGIYLDDALSGQTVYGNLLVNVPSIGLHLGGGRDLDVRNNIIINCNDASISYDQRAIDGVFGGWFTHSSKEGGDMWTVLENSPYKTEIWKKAFPQMTRFSNDFNNTDDPNFVPNPAYSKVTGNLIVNLTGSIGRLDECPKKYSTVNNNAVYKLTKQNDIFTDLYNGDYSIKENSIVYDIIPNFEQLPLKEIGRY